MRWLKIPNDPIFHDVARKHTRLTPPIVGIIGTTIGIHSAFQKLGTGNPIDQVMPGIIDDLFWAAIGTGASILVIFLHYWFIKR